MTEVKAIEMKLNKATEQALHSIFTPKHQSAEDAGSHFMFITIMVFVAIKKIFGSEGLLDFIENALEELDKHPNLGIDEDKFKTH